MVFFQPWVGSVVGQQSIDGRLQVVAVPTLEDQVELITQSHGATFAHEIQPRAGLVVWPESAAETTPCTVATRSPPRTMTAVIVEETFSVELAPVDDIVPQQLIRAAITEARADEVTPPLTPGPSWTPKREAGLRNYHHRCRTGLTGPAGEATWAVVVKQEVVGSVRLKNT